TRLGAEQALTFGFWRFCELSNDEFVCLEEGILAADNGLSKAETAVLRNCYRTVRPQTVDNGADRLLLYSRAQFVKKVLAMAMQANALIVGFNLPFDLSRIAVDWEKAKNGGWSL